MDRVFLIPGFFGFSNIGEMKYFFHVRRALEAALAQRGLPATIHDVATLPTSSLQRRAGRLAEVISKEAAAKDPVHLVGHSTGGLDARLLVSPSWPAAPVGWGPERVRTVTAIATPHHGAPIAEFLSTHQGERWLRVLSILTLRVVRLGGFATVPADLLMGAVSRAGSMAGVDEGLLDQVWKDVLRDFDRGRQEELRLFFQDVWKDRSLLGQLTPKGLREIEALLSPRPGVRYGSVVLRARPPGQGHLPALPDLRPGNRLYRMLHAAARWSPSSVPPQPAAEQSKSLAQGLGVLPSGADNDAIVPTLSQVHGELVHVATGDHLDVLGYFRGPSSAPPHVDWLRTCSDYDRADFEATWNAVADWIVAGSRGAR